MKLGLRLNEGRADRPVSGAQLATALHGADNAALEVAFAKTIDLRQHCVRSSRILQEFPSIFLIIKLGILLIGREETHLS